jgi:hypothetical protein
VTARAQAKFPTADWDYGYNGGTEPTLARWITKFSYARMYWNNSNGQAMDTVDDESIWFLNIDSGSLSGRSGDLRFQFYLEHIVLLHPDYKLHPVGTTIVDSGGGTRYMKLQCLNNFTQDNGKGDLTLEGVQVTVERISGQPTWGEFTDPEA